MNANKKRKQQGEDGSYKAGSALYDPFVLCHGAISFKKLKAGGDKMGEINKKGEKRKWKQKIKNV